MESESSRQELTERLEEAQDFQKPKKRLERVAFASRLEHFTWAYELPADCRLRLLKVIVPR